MSNAMPSFLLERLTTDDFLDAIGFLPPPAALRRVLQHCPDVRYVETALRCGEIAEQDVRDFVARLVEEFRPGETFRHNLALAALAVAMERWGAPFVDDYLLDLARVERVEFGDAVRVTRLCLKARFALAQNQIKTFRYPGLSRIPGRALHFPTGRQAPFPGGRSVYPARARYTEGARCHS